MQKIIWKEKNLSDLLQNKKYTIHYYQREYKWWNKQIEELIDDLTWEFLEYHDNENSRDMVENYWHYYLGSIVLTNTEGQNAIIDWQQRLTSITLLLIYLNNLQKERNDKVSIDNLIFSERYWSKSFNISVDERKECLDALYRWNDYNIENSIESVKNIYDRYNDITNIFPEELKEEALPYFIDWLIYNVDLVEISAVTEQDAHKIFVSMNDRWLSLTPTEMLKWFLLSEIKSDEIRNSANDIWKQNILILNQIDKDEDANFFRNWLRSQYTESIRETKRWAVNEDFDIIGTTFHKWVRENKAKIDLTQSRDYENFVSNLLPKYAKIYIKLKEYSSNFVEEFECVFYNANRNLTLQYQVILSSIAQNDNDDIINEKIKIVSRYIDQFIARRVFNFKTVDYSSIKNAMFNISKKIRRKDVEELKKLLKDELNAMEFNLDWIDRFYLNGFTSRYMLHILARITHYIEKWSWLNTKFYEYVDRGIKNPYDIEHIWADHFERHEDEFSNNDDFQATRNKFWDLILLPQDKNRSFNNNEYEEKLEMYFWENLLAKSLHENCYKNNPHFLKFKSDNNLEFKEFKTFKKDDINNRQNLYKEICKKIWNIDLI